MFLRKYARFLSILCVALYMPVLLGSGECVALCLESDGSFALDYSHRCGIADYPGMSKNTAASEIFLSEPSAPENCRDIPLAVGSHFHFAPEVNNLLFSGIVTSETPLAQDDFLVRPVVFSLDNSPVNRFLYPSSFSTTAHSILII
ncbi:MAG: hypothetical protein WCU00_02600 [Candidatus Latescibacterota bacterium]|jgi:hypothetical protein